MPFLANKKLIITKQLYFTQVLSFCVIFEFFSNTGYKNLEMLQNLLKPIQAGPNS